MLCQPHRNMFPLLKLGPHCFQIGCFSHNNLHEKYVCGGNDDQDPSGDDRRDGIMTLWGANVLLQSLRVTGMRLCCTGLGLACCSMQQLFEKDKALWKGASQGSEQEQGLSASSVTLLLYKLALSLSMREREEQRRKQCTFCLCEETKCSQHHV